MDGKAARLVRSTPLCLVRGVDLGCRRIASPAPQYLFTQGTRMGNTDREHRNSERFIIYITYSGTCGCLRPRARGLTCQEGFPTHLFPPS